MASERSDAVRLTFDRGTVVLGGGFPHTFKDLPGVLWDPRTRQYRAPAWQYKELLNGLAERRIPVDDQVRGEFLDSGARWQEAALRPYQQAAVGAWRLGQCRGLVVLPTGSGKTRVALAAMRSTEPAAVLCLVPTRVLLHQWVKELTAWYGGSVGIWGDGQRVTHPITVATFESGLRRAAELGARFELLVVDEVHHFGERQRDEVLEMCVAPMRLGITATPPEREPQLRCLADLVGPVVFELTLADLAGSYLAAYDTVILHASLDEQERARYESEYAPFARVFRAHRRVSPEGSWREFLAAACRSEEGRRALACWRRAKQIQAFPRAKRQLLRELLERHHAQRVLVFTSDNASAYQVSRENLVMPLTCDIKRRERDAAIQRFRSGELRALVSSRVLNEGFDVPDAEVAIIVGGALGGREHVQRVGRLLRPAPGKRALIYELVASTPSELRSSARRWEALAS